MMNRMCAGHKVAWLLVWVGALNWGLVGFFQFNLVNFLLGNWPMIERIVYAVVGLSAVFMLLKDKCKGCLITGKM